MKRFLALCLCLCILFSLAPHAAARDVSFAQTLAEDLKDLGLFRGVSETDFALSRPATRAEALVMLLRLLGQESQALSFEGTHPFTDVPGWADRYVAYAWENGLTKGVSDTAFGTSDATCQMYATFLLRALGYSDSRGDFTWNDPYTLSTSLGILPGSVDRTAFLRADVAIMSYAALPVYLALSDKTLAQKLIDAGAFTRAQYDAVYRSTAISSYAPAQPQTMTAESLFEKCSPAVFYIEVYDRAGKATASGSGFFLSADGTAVTNYHVIAGAAAAKLRTQDGKIYDVGGLWDWSKEEDWAILQVNGSGFTALEPGGTVKTGQVVYAIGSPLGLQNTLSEGLVSTASRELDGQAYIQISTPISSGSSGGALLDENGRVVGITSAGFEEGQNLNLAIPIAKVLNKAHTKLTPMTETVSAADLLQSFVAENANYTFLEKFPAVALRDRISSGTTTFILYYDTDTATNTVNLTLNATGGVEVSVWLDLSPNGTVHNVAYYYYGSRFSSDWTASGSAALEATGFTQNSAVTFGTYEGAAADRTDHGELAASMLQQLLSNLDSLFKAYPGYFGSVGLDSFGFSQI